MLNSITIKLIQVDQLEFIYLDLVKPSNSIFGVFELIQFFFFGGGALSIDADEKLSQALVLKKNFFILTSFLTFSVFNLVKASIFKIANSHSVLNLKFI